MDPRLAEWHHEYGYTRRDTGQVECGHAVFEFTLDADAPMTLQLGPACFVQPDRHGYSNGGNVPWIAELLVPSDLHWPSWIIHDSACREHCLYFAGRLAGPYHREPITSLHAARIMRAGLYAAGHEWRGSLAYHAVRLLGPRWRLAAAKV